MVPRGRVRTDAKLLKPAAVREAGKPLGAPVWAILTLPFGVTVGYATVAAPFVLRSRGVDMPTIAVLSQVVQLPHVIKLLWSPVLDSGPRRRTWYFASVGVTAVCLALTALVPLNEERWVAGVRPLWIYAALLFAAQAAVATSATAILALMAVTVPESIRGKAAGWHTMGNLAGTATGGALVVWMVSAMSPIATATALAALCAVASLPAALIRETPLPRQSAVRLIVDVLREAFQTLRSREGWTGMLICLSPVGAGALTNLFSALARDYAPDEATALHLVVTVNGVLGGLVNAVGALVGGYVADRMNRRTAYVLFGGVTALCAVAMAIGPPVPTVFTIGCLAYQLANGLCYAAFYAFVLDLLGHRRGVTTQLALFAGASNLAISYVTAFDGWAYDHVPTFGLAAPSPGRIGMLGMDALATFIGIAILAVARVGRVADAKR